MTSFPLGCLVRRDRSRRNFCDGNGRSAQSCDGSANRSDEQALPIATIAPMVAEMDDTDAQTPSADPFTEMLRLQGEAARQMMANVLPEAVDAIPGDEAIAEWGEATRRLQAMWLEFHTQQSVPE